MPSDSLKTGGEKFEKNLGVYDCVPDCVVSSSGKYGACVLVYGTSASF